MLLQSLKRFLKDIFPDSIFFTISSSLSNAFRTFPLPWCLLLIIFVTLASKLPTKPWPLSHPNDNGSAVIIIAPSGNLFAMLYPLFRIAIGFNDSNTDTSAITRLLNWRIEWWKALIRYFRHFNPQAIGIYPYLGWNYLFAQPHDNIISQIRLFLDDDSFEPFKTVVDEETKLRILSIGSLSLSSSIIILSKYFSIARDDIASVAVVRFNCRHDSLLSVRPSQQRLRV